MKRRRVLGGICAVALTGPIAVVAQPVRVRRIGYLSLTSIRETPSRERQAFLDGLRDHGYVVGRTIHVVYASAENEPEFLDAACADLVRKKVEVIVAAGTVATTAAWKATRTIPIVAVGDPTGAGGVQSLSHPGQNVTGLTIMLDDLAGKRVQLVKEVLPRAKHFGVLWELNNANGQRESRAAITAARNLGLMVVELPIVTSAQLEAVFGSPEVHKLDAIYVVFAPGLITELRSDIVEFGLRQRVPVVSGWRSITEAGGLFSYAPDLPAVFRRAAFYVRRVLNGADPGSLPIEQPTKFELVLNAKTARVLGIAFPQSLLLQADEVIQ